GVSTPLFACKASPETVDMPIRKRAIASKRSAPRVAPSRPGSEKARKRWSKIKAVLVQSIVRRLNGQTHYRAKRTRLDCIERLLAEGKSKHG
ncbi:hypothetical protein AB1399_00115, partial [Hydrogenibacillus schlegelii]|uniref:hypothetical protein n=1 Tax=Hydrogenibacillus schlegelii TaxID=1484 RepID=UPI0034A03E53